MVAASVGSEGAKFAGNGLRCSDWFRQDNPEFFDSEGSSTPGLAIFSEKISEVCKFFLRGENGEADITKDYP